MTCNNISSFVFADKLTLATKFQRKVAGDKKLQLALGDPTTSGIILSELIDEYMKQYQGKVCG